MLHMHGHLSHKKLFSWKKRFWVLSGENLVCYNQKGDTVPLKLYKITQDFSLERMSTAIPSEKGQGGTGSRNGKKKKHGFILRGPGKLTIRLRCDDAKAEAKWMNILQRIITQEQDMSKHHPVRPDTRLWWAETKQGRVCFELDHHYEMGKILGSGGYGVVVGAINTRIGNNVAIKKVTSLFDDMIVTKRIAREVRLLHHFDHPNIVKLVDILPPPTLDTFEDLYMVLECMDTDLHSVIYSGREYHEVHIKFIMYQLLCAIRYIHSAGIVHRDIKPSNVLINDNCELKLCDFGLARTTCGTATLGMDNDGYDEKWTKYVVTRWWRAPELLLETEYGQLIDIWSAGCILGEMIKKSPLFMGSNTLQMLKAIVRFYGTESCRDVGFVSKWKARKYLLDMPNVEAPPLEEHFPGSTPEAMDLFQGITQWNPNRRMAAFEALAHPWFDSFQHSGLEKCSPCLADLGSIEHASLTRPGLSDVICEDMRAFHGAIPVFDQEESFRSNITEPMNSEM